MTNISNQEFNKSNSYVEVNTTTYPLKIAFIGNSGEAKSSIIKRFCGNKFDEEKIITTISAIFVHKKIKVDSYTELDLEIWDPAGKERFRFMNKGYLRGYHGIFIVFDFADNKSFEDLYSWLNERNLSDVKKNWGKMLIGNKFDLDEKKVDNSAIDKFLNDNNIKYLNVSAKNGVNIESMFEMMGNECVKIIRENGFKDENNDNDDDNNIVLKKNNDKENEVNLSTKKHKAKNKRSVNFFDE